MFDTKNLKGDIFGGVNAGIVALPAALGFGTLAGLEPIYGLYCAIFLGLFAAALGGSKTLISNPTGPMAVVTLGVVTKLTHKLDLGEVSFSEKLEVVWPYLFFVILTAALVQILFGVFKLGKYIHYIPTPVVSGFMSGIGVIIIVSQIPKFLGADFSGGGTLNVLGALPELMQCARPLSILLAIGTMGIIYIFPKITKAIPSPLVGIVLMTIIAYFLVEESEHSIYRIAEIPKELPNPFRQLDFFSKIVDMFFGEGKEGLLRFVLLNGLTLAIIGIIDALLTAVVGDQLTKEKHDSDREMIGQGLGNAISALFGGMMGAGTTPATVLNIQSGGRTRLSGIIHALLLVLILVAFTTVASMIPKAALAGLLITVGVSILDFEVFKQLKKIPVQDNIIMFVVLICTSCWDLMYAVAAGLIIAALIFMKKMADVVEGESNNTKFDRLVDQLVDTFDNTDHFREKVEVRNLNGPMFFGFASRFQDQMDEIEDTNKAILLNFGGVTYMDQSGMYTLKEAVKRLVDNGKTVAFSELRERETQLLTGINVIPEMVDDQHVFSSVEEAVMWLNEPGHLDDSFAADDELYIPSAYTPNGDGINDEWQLRNIERYPNCVVTIHDREGREIFCSQGYKEMWEGIYKGNRLPSDQYLYSIDLHGDGLKIKKGKVSIFR